MKNEEKVYCIEELGWAAAAQTESRFSWCAACRINLTHSLTHSAFAPQGRKERKHKNKCICICILYYENENW